MLPRESSVLVVEDEPLISIMVEDMLHDMGLRVTGTAQTEQAALDLLRSDRPSVALLDVNLGSTDSLMVASACRAAQIPIIFTTGYTVNDLPEGCRDTPVLAKPFSPEELEEVVMRVLRDRAALASISRDALDGAISASQ
jgi:DNA-binding response OmpR family regulator